jgi:transcriptional regulator with XRE-family HTH domain
MSDGSKLTAAACRAARALLNWSVRDLQAAAGVSPNTIATIESGGTVRAETAQKVVDAFAANRVQITNGDGTGARLLAAQP